MAHWIDLDTPHGPVRAWRADPGGPSHGAVVVLQEIFGANAHIRAVTERFATDNAVGGGGPPQEFAAFIAREQKTWSDIVKRAQIKAD